MTGVTRAIVLRVETLSGEASYIPAIDWGDVEAAIERAKSTPQWKTITVGLWTEPGEVEGLPKWLTAFRVADIATTDGRLDHHA